MYVFYLRDGSGDYVKLVDSIEDALKLCQGLDGDCYTVQKVRFLLGEIETKL